MTGNRRADLLAAAHRAAIKKNNLGACRICGGATMETCYVYCTRHFRELSPDLVHEVKMGRYTESDAYLRVPKSLRLAVSSSHHHRMSIDGTWRMYPTTVRMKQVLALDYRGVRQGVFETSTEVYQYLQRVREIYSVRNTFASKRLIK